MFAAYPPPPAVSILEGRWPENSEKFIFVASKGIHVLQDQGKELVNREDRIAVLQIDNDTFLRAEVFQPQPASLRSSNADTPCYLLSCSSLIIIILLLEKIGKGETLT